MLVAEIYGSIVGPGTTVDIDSSNISFEVLEIHAGSRRFKVRTIDNDKEGFIPFSVFGHNVVKLIDMNDSKLADDPNTAFKVRKLNEIQ